MSEARVAIAGAGPAGLVAARHLADSGVDVDVYEAEPTVGGRVRTREHEGFTLDRGFQVLLTGYPAVQRELDLDALDLRPIPPGAVLCGRADRAILSDPFRDPSALGETLLNRSVTTGDKLRLWRLRRDLRDRSWSAIAAGSDRSTLEALLDRGFSDAFVEAFARPFYGGITLDPTLSTSATVFERVTKAMVAGDVALPADGMGAVTEQLARRAEDAGAAIHTDAPVTDLESGDGDATLTVDGDRVTTDAAVVATDAPTARDLTGVESIPTAGRGCVTQYYAVPESKAPDGPRLHLGRIGADETGGSSDERPIESSTAGSDSASGRRVEWPAHVLTLSNVAPEYGDGDRALVQATYLRDVDAPPARLDDGTRRALETWYAERQFGDLVLLATDRVEFGQFAQPPGIHDRLPDVDAPAGRCYLAGEYTHWSSHAGALQSGRRAAQRLIAELR